MGDIPAVKPGEWVYVGKDFGKHAVVCHVYSDPALGDIEVVYLDDRSRATNEGVVWREDHWEFKHSGSVGGTVDNYDRLREFVRILRRGRHE